MKKTKDDLLTFLAEAQLNDIPIPSIHELGQQLKISTATVREQLEVAKSLGVVDVKTNSGIKSKEFSLTQTLNLAMKYGVTVEPQLFESYANLRRHIESSYWYESVPLLTKQDMDRLQLVVDQAFVKIRRVPVMVPYEEHARFHLSIYKPLDNPIVNSILETYWELYQDSGLQFIVDQEYLVSVWDQHQKMVDAIGSREFEKGYEVLIAHMDLFKQGKRAVLKQRFE